MLSKSEMSFIEAKYRREALENRPSGYFLLNANDTLRRDDLLWSFTSREWLRADSPEWTVRCTSAVDVGDLICAIRKVELTEFEKSVPAQRKFTITR